MAVRDALLVLLMNGPAYGFQLHGDLAARTGGRRVVNVGQTYSTLERLTAQGLVEPAGSTDDGLPLHRLTRAGRAAGEAWLGGEDGAGTDPWHESVDRVLIAVSMPSIEAGPVIEAERERWSGRRAAADATVDAGMDARARLAAGAASAEHARADAMLAWLEELVASDLDAAAFAPSAERPKRGRRPSRTAQASSAQAPTDA
ncbi:PadR family transcriptional regulator [Agromyces bracchium]|uniref:PadR family transcriptional regulator n=1 Tax=Agromyces bracchium TaxID=88376 RepID=A0A6I3M0M0_9MICO|nr:helix-turn-helix transcriptional regulator [Agromyces bracchium]MTH68220.1 PadR family transcriptional regulator [Agromyces bracchium]